MSASTSRAWLEHYSDWTPHTLDYGDKTIVDYYRDNLRANANKSATYFFGRTQTYAELDAQVRAAAAGLKAFGIRPGDKVAIVLPNCPQHVAAFYAVQLLGATVVEHNPLYTAPELEGLLNDHGARVAISWDKTASTLEKLRSTTPLETIVSVNMVQAMPPLKRLALRLPIPPLAAKREQLTSPAPNTVEWSTLIGSAIGGDGSNPMSLRSPKTILRSSSTPPAPPENLKARSSHTATSLPTPSRARPGCRTWASNKSASSRHCPSSTPMA